MPNRTLVERPLIKPACVEGQAILGTSREEMPMLESEFGLVGTIDTLLPSTAPRKRMDQEDVERLSPAGEAGLRDVSFFGKLSSGFRQIPEELFRILEDG
jgi:hypothetical protein